jgi:F-type H+-transporting ATPase subunit delta
MANLVAKRYASALFELSKEADIVATHQQQLEFILSIFEQNKELKTVLAHPKVTETEKKELLNSVLSKFADRLIGNFFSILIDKNRQGNIQDIIKEYIILADDYNNVERTLVVSVLPLEQSELEKLTVKLSKMFNKNIVITNKVDKSILGGLLVKVGDRVIDGTLRGKINALRGELNTITLQEAEVS